MIEPGKNGRRSGSVAKGRCEAGCFAKNERPLVRWILSYRSVAEPALKDAHEVTFVHGVLVVDAVNVNRF